MPSGRRPQPPVGTARVAISGTGGAGNPWVNVYWLNLDATTHVQADFHYVIDQLASNWFPGMFDLMSSAYHLTEVKGSWLYAAGQSLESSQTYAAIGGGSSTYETDAVSAVVNWSISDFYRGGHPRSYIAGVPSGQVVNGRTLNSTFASNLAAAAQAMITGMNAVTHGGISAVQLGTVRFASGNSWLSPPVFRAYQGASVRNVLGTQRRRYAA